jgi:hypothetical protein
VIPSGIVMVFAGRVLLLLCHGNFLLETQPTKKAGVVEYP